MRCNKNDDKHEVNYEDQQSIILGITSNSKNTEFALPHHETTTLQKFCKVDQIDQLPIQFRFKQFELIKEQLTFIISFEIMSLQKIKDRQIQHKFFLKLKKIENLIQTCFQNILLENGDFFFQSHDILKELKVILQYIYKYSRNKIEQILNKYYYKEKLKQQSQIYDQYLQKDILEQIIKIQKCSYIQFLKAKLIDENNNSTLGIYIHKIIKEIKEQHLFLLEQKLQSKDYEYAFNIMASLKIISENGEVQSAIFKQTNICYKSKNFDEYGLIYSKFYEMTQNIAKFEYRIGKIFKRKQQYEKAKKQYQLAFDLDCRYYKIYEKLGMMEIINSELHNAIKYFDVGLQFDFQNYILYLYKGNSLTKLEQYEDALLCYDQALQFNDRNYEIYLNKGTILYKLSQYRQAIEMFDQSIELNANCAQTYLNKGVAIDNLGHFRQAIEQYDNAISIDALNYGAYIRKGLSLEKLGQDEESLRIYDIAQQIQPTLFDGYLKQGNVLQKLERFQEAILAYDKGLKNGQLYQKQGDVLFSINHKNKKFQILVNKGNALCQLEQYEEAIQYYDRAIQIQPNDSVSLSNREFALRNFNEQLIKGIQKMDVGKIEIALPNQQKKNHGESSVIRNGDLFDKKNYF